MRSDRYDRQLFRPEFVYGQIHGLVLSASIRCCSVNPFKPEFTIVIFIHYKPRIAVAILDL